MILPNLIQSLCWASWATWELDIHINLCARPQGSELGLGSHDASLENGHCKLQRLCWGHWSATALPSTPISSSLPGWFLSSSLCVFCCPPPTALAGASNLVCRCWGPAGAGTAAATASQTAQLEISSPPALLPPPDTWSLRLFLLFVGIFFFFLFTGNPNQCCDNLTLLGLPRCVTGHRERNKPIRLDKQFPCHWQRWTLTPRLWRQEAEGTVIAVGQAEHPFHYCIGKSPKEALHTSHQFNLSSE